MSFNVLIDMQQYGRWWRLFLISVAFVALLNYKVGIILLYGVEITTRYAE